MPIIDIRQGTTRWFSWRRKGITASMMPIIMRTNKYKSRAALWAEVIGEETTEENAHILRGRTLEPVARDFYNRKYGKNFKPVCVEENEWILASLDGLYKEEVIEIKCPESLDKFDNRFEMYYPQLQWQLKAAKKFCGIYFEYVDENTYKEKRYMADVDYQAKMEKEALYFKKCIDLCTPPDEQFGEEIVEISEKYISLDTQEKKIKEEKEEIKKTIQDITENIFSCGQLKGQWIEKSGNIDYEALIRDNCPQVDLTLYRKKSTRYFQLKVGK